jgi:hypothetical protein
MSSDGGRTGLGAPQRMVHRELPRDRRLLLDET